MCTRFVYNGIDKIVGFNFDIDLSVWDHTVITEENRFYIGIKMPDGLYHSFHGINKNGNVGTLLYVHGNENAKVLFFKMSLEYIGLFCLRDSVKHDWQGENNDKNKYRKN